MVDHFSKINTFLFDLDDTLISTHEIFERQMIASASYIAGSKGLHDEEVKEKLFSAVDDAYTKVVVNPDRLWSSVFDVLKVEYGLSIDEVDVARDIIEEIYTTIPNLLDGSTDLLEHLLSAGHRVGMVTHALRDWTVFKLESTGLSGYFEDIYLVDVNEYKGKKHWDDAAKVFSIDKATSCVVGDSLSGDLIPSIEAGYAMQVRVNNGVGWHVYGSKDIPEGIINVTSPKELHGLLTTS